MLWNLTGGQRGGAVHATDHSNASRTMLMSLSSLDWDDWLMEQLQVPRLLLPEIKPSLSYFGETQLDFLETPIPIMAILGDQQAALFAQGCDRPGLLKCTYGTGCFLMAHTGTQIAQSQHQLLATLAWTSAQSASYALEGSMFTTGACIQWLRDGLQIITTAADTDAMAASVADSNGVYFVPALSGLGAPHWDMSARGAFLGLTGGSERVHLVRAVLESIAYQVQEVVQAMGQDLHNLEPAGTALTCLKVDGGACQNDFLMQFQADLLGIPVARPAMLEATAQGAAFAAGLAAGFWQDYSQLVASRTVERCFYPGQGANQAAANFATWQQAVERVKHWLE